VPQEAVDQVACERFVIGQGDRARGGAVGVLDGYDERSGTVIRDEDAKCMTSADHSSSSGLAFNQTYEFSPLHATRPGRTMLPTPGA